MCFLQINKMWKYRSELVSISSVLSGIPVSMLQLTYSFIPSIQNKHQRSWLMPVLPLQYLTAIWDSNPSICGTAPVHSLPLAEASSVTTSERLLVQHTQWSRSCNRHDLLPWLFSFWAKGINFCRCSRIMAGAQHCPEAEVSFRGPCWQPMGAGALPAAVFHFNTPTLKDIKPR